MVLQRGHNLATVPIDSSRPCNLCNLVTVLQRCHGFATSPRLQLPCDSLATILQLGHDLNRLANYKFAAYSFVTKLQPRYAASSRRFATSPCHAVTVTSQRRHGFNCVVATATSSRLQLRRRNRYVVTASIASSQPLRRHGFNCVVATATSSRLQLRRRNRYIVTASIASSHGLATSVTTPLRCHNFNYLVAASSLRYDPATWATSLQPRHDPSRSCNLCNVATGLQHCHNFNCHGPVPSLQICNLVTVSPRLCNLGHGLATSPWLCNLGHGLATSPRPCNLGHGLATSPWLCNLGHGLATSPRPCNLGHGLATSPRLQLTRRSPATWTTVLQPRHGFNCLDVASLPPRRAVLDDPFYIY
ncbi:hypothetical protein GGR50DRAFT_699009 [Xylaria sp. CBS 124048]|nr:hypothetical protein GGR50DRAFT_699009 [Xylaria sp. CBS 124048]